LKRSPGIMCVDLTAKKATTTSFAILGKSPNRSLSDTGLQLKPSTHVE
jgi:hypothetical protein